MVIQYPDIGLVKTPSESIKDENGNWSESSLNTVYESRCRVEPNSSSQYISGPNGEKILFSCIVYMPKPVTMSVPWSLNVSESQVIYSGETIFYKATVDKEGDDSAEVPGISGHEFTLKMDGYPLELNSEYLILPNGFKLIGDAGTIKNGQRFELTKFYRFTYGTSDSGISISSEFLITPGSQFEVWKGSILKVKDTVKQFSMGQLNMRVWI